MLDADRDIRIALHSDGRPDRELRIFRDPTATVSVRIDAAELIAPQPRRPLTFDLHVGGQPALRSRAERNGTFSVEVRQDIETILALFIPASQVGQPYAAQWLSDLEKSGKAQGFLDALRQQFTEIETVSVQLDAGVAGLHVRLAGQTRMLPINALSAGMTKLAGLLLGTTALSGGVVLIDEIENGFHHSRHAPM
jgi:hypothetical protein